MRYLFAWVVDDGTIAVNRSGPAPVPLVTTGGEGPAMRMRGLARLTAQQYAARVRLVRYTAGDVLDTQDPQDS